ncbi:hypothetical protein C8N46_103172 [Kordia periserrulae]|uniref:Uncharacterized protein n=1 Tax=Kordia periserrulae TaxID=701523 RepID=A0A2T6C173_9FLAO|nr:hypothetical protein [Kordia periserrulae]PTX62074.1 hypothetical protein C8N46_103172 [Kordia periserrulae]
MKFLKIITIGLLLMTLNSFAANPMSCSDRTELSERTDLIDKMKEDKDVFSLIFKSQVYALLATMVNDAEIALEDREQVAASKRELVEDIYKNKMNVENKFPEFSKLNKEEKSKVMQKITKAISNKLKTTMGCFTLGIAGEIAACGVPALTGWALTKWNWCMATTLVGDVVVSASNPEAAVIAVEDGAFEAVMESELSFCGKIATGLNVGWAGVANCLYTASIGVITGCIATLAW